MTYIDVSARIAPWVDDYAPDADVRMHEADLEAEGRFAAEDANFDVWVEIAEAAVEGQRDAEVDALYRSLRAAHPNAGAER
jgi:hypothetical protein